MARYKFYIVLYCIVLYFYEPYVSAVVLICSDFTNLCPRDLSIKKEAAQGTKNDTAQDTRQDEDQCHDLSTTSRPRPDESPTNKQQVMLHERFR